MLIRHLFESIIIIIVYINNIEYDTKTNSTLKKLKKLVYL